MSLERPATIGFITRIDPLGLQVHPPQQVVEARVVAEGSVGTAKPLFVGSNPTAALTLVFKVCQISKSPIPGSPPPLSGDLSITVVAGMQDGTFPDARMR